MNDNSPHRATRVRMTRQDADTCATPVQLWLLIHEQLDPSEDATLTNHIEHCLSCQHRLEELSKPSGDSGAVETIGSYQLGVELGRGSNGTVYLAQSTDGSQPKAIKILSPQVAQTDVGRQRFLREIRVLQSLTHPGIVGIHDSGEADGRMYLVMDYVKGGTLADYSGRRPIPESVAAAIIHHVALAIQYCHDHGVIHRDLKPRNILMGGFVAGNETTSEHSISAGPLVADFGIAKSQVESLSMTETGAVLGTLDYMAPEQLEYGQNVTAAADVYSMGAILYELLTGGPPHRATTFPEMITFIRNEEPLRLRTIVPTASSSLELICERCLQKQPSERYASAGALAEDLRRFLDNKRPLIRPIGFLTRASSYVRRRPGTAGIVLSIGFSAILVVVAALIFAWQKQQHAVFALRQRDEIQRLFDESLKAYSMLDTDIEVIVEGKERPTEELQQQLQHLVAFLEPLLKEHPEQTRYRAILANAWHYKGRLPHDSLAGEADSKTVSEICDAYERVIHHCELLKAMDTLQEADRLKFSILCANTRNNLGNAIRDYRDPASAEPHYRTAIREWDELISEYPDDSNYQVFRLLAKMNLMRLTHRQLQDKPASADRDNEVDSRVQELESQLLQWIALFQKYPFQRSSRLNFFEGAAELKVQLLMLKNDPDPVRTAIQELIDRCPDAKYSFDNAVWYTVELLERTRSDEDAASLCFLLKQSHLQKRIDAERFQQVLEWPKLRQAADKDKNVAAVVDELTAIYRKPNEQ